MYKVMIMDPGLRVFSTLLLRTQKWAIAEFIPNLLSYITVSVFNSAHWFCSTGEKMWNM